MRPEPQLRALADLASGLAGDARLDDFATVADQVVASGAEVSLFVAELDVELVGKGGIAPAKVVDGAAMDLLGKECERLMDCGDAKSLVQVMEILAGFKFPVRELAKPANVIRVLIDQRSPNLAIRYACIFPHAQILFCTIIHEFGKKGIWYLH
ncbi:pentatricopeptide repeat-containing protein At5g02830, chloroplastic-like [Eucalyptus grandis]|uniref:pentatricopeptide repeat-containing protein At5g02830, chloroplastic-like n=1 Tax=Eucalyptus grandis TaxID=71139 RepID=UPI00192E9B73|nr:pentatricopeptide repeat-containing protein At5g02830, chloroplastic-like [Eucalyptus grandis]